MLNFSELGVRRLDQPILITDLTAYLHFNVHSSFFIVSMRKVERRRILIKSIASITLRLHTFHFSYKFVMNDRYELKTATFVFDEKSNSIWMENVVRVTNNYDWIKCNIDFQCVNFPSISPYYGFGLKVVCTQLNDFSFNQLNVFMKLN